MGSHGFPRCIKGDVEIYLTETDETLVVLSERLKFGSEFFRASMSDKWKPSPGGSDGTGNEHRHVYELRFDKGTDVGVLCRQGRSDSTKTDMVLGYHALCRPTDTLNRRFRIVRAHLSMLAALHDEYPTLGARWEDARQSILALADVAKLYGADQALKTHINLALHTWRDDILVRCTDAPYDMVEFGMRAKCAWIFQEAASNLLGGNKARWTANRPVLVRLGLSDLFDKKRQIFEQTLQQKQIEIFSMFPFARLNWLSIAAINIVRQHLGEALNHCQGSLLVGAYAKAYRELAMPTEAFLHMPEVEQHFRWSLPSYNPCYMSQLRPHLDQVLTSCSEILRPILHKATKRHICGPLPDALPLLFMTIEDDELPWAERCSNTEGESIPDDDSMWSFEDEDRAGQRV